MICFTPWLVGIHALALSQRATGDDNLEEQDYFYTTESGKQKEAPLFFDFIESAGVKDLLCVIIA